MLNIFVGRKMTLKGQRNFFGCICLLKAGGHLQEFAHYSLLSSKGLPLRYLKFDRFTMEEEFDDFGEGGIDFDALADLEETEEYQEALECINEAEKLKSSRLLQWADEAGVDLTEVFEYEEDQYWNAQSWDA